MTERNGHRRLVLPVALDRGRGSMLKCLVETGEMSVVGERRIVTQSKFGERLTKLGDAIIAREPAGRANPPQSGTDASSRRHMLALILSTIAIMAFGLIVAFT